MSAVLSGCALAPGEAGIPIIPMIMIPVGVLLIGWGLTMIPSRGERETPPEEPGEEARVAKDG